MSSQRTNLKGKTVAISMKSMTQGSDTVVEARKRLLQAALPHVVFDGWTDRTLKEAATDSGVDSDLICLAYPRGGVDLALAFHFDGDARLAADLAATDLSERRFSDRVAWAVIHRLELSAGHREEVRRAAALFALPNHAPDGMKAVWNTADTIWTGLGDSSTDYNWYTKRATLSAVWSSTLLFWLGDETENFQATRDFVGRRIDNVMQIEKAKASVRKSPLADVLLRGPRHLLDRVKAPDDSVRSTLPGYLKPKL